MATPPRTAVAILAINVSSAARATTISTLSVPTLRSATPSTPPRPGAPIVNTANKRLMLAISARWARSRCHTSQLNSASAGCDGTVKRATRLHLRARTSGNKRRLGCATPSPVRSPRRSGRRSASGQTKRLASVTSQPLPAIPPLTDMLVSPASASDVAPCRVVVIRRPAGLAAPRPDCRTVRRSASAARFGVRGSVAIEACKDRVLDAQVVASPDSCRLSARRRSPAIGMAAQPRFSVPSFFVVGQQRPCARAIDQPARAVEPPAAPAQERVFRIPQQLRRTAHGRFARPASCVRASSAWVKLASSPFRAAAASAVKPRLSPLA